MNVPDQNSKLRAIALKNTRSTLLAYAVPAFLYSPVVVYLELTTTPYWIFVALYGVTLAFVFLNLVAIKHQPKISYEVGAPFLYAQIIFFMMIFFLWVILLQEGRYGALFFALSMLIYTYAYGGITMAIAINTSLIVLYLAGSYFTLKQAGSFERMQFDFVTILAFLPTSIVIGRAGSKLAMRKRKVKSLLLEQKQTQQQLQETLLKLEHAATTDELTGLINRREINKRLSYEYNQMGRSLAPMCVLILDLDHFKQINDNYGHPCGDAVLMAVAKKLSSAFRETDSVSRWGGEEFIILMPDTSLKDALAVSKRALDSISSKPIVFEQQALTVTASGGLCEVSPLEKLEAALHQADECLYQAKASGRNRIVCKQSSDNVVNL